MALAGFPRGVDGNADDVARLHEVIHGSPPLLLVAASPGRARRFRHESRRQQAGGLHEAAPVPDGRANLPPRLVFLAVYVPALARLERRPAARVALEVIVFDGIDLVGRRGEIPRVVRDPRVDDRPESLVFA